MPYGRERQQREGRERLAQGQGQSAPVGKGPTKSKGPKVQGECFPTFIHSLSKCLPHASTCQAVLSSAGGTVNESCENLGTSLAVQGN